MMHTRAQEFDVNKVKEQGEKEYEDFLDQMRGLLHDHTRGGRDRPTMKALAVKMFVCVATLDKFLDGTTKRPSSWTINRLVEALELRFALVPASAVIAEEIKPRSRRRPKRKK